MFLKSYIYSFIIINLYIYISQYKLQDNAKHYICDIFFQKKKKNSIILKFPSKNIFNKSHY